MRSLDAAVLETHLPSYKELRDVMDRVYEGKGFTSKIGVRARLALRKSKGESFGSVGSLHPIAHLLVRNPSSFYPLVTAWSAHIESARPVYSLGSPRPYKPMPLMPYLHRYIPESNPSAFNSSVALMLGCPPDVAAAMTTKRLHEPDNLPILPLWSFHLGLPADHYANAADMFDIYTSRLMTGMQEDRVVNYLARRAYDRAYVRFTDKGVDGSLVLAWQIARAIMVNMSMDDAVSLASMGVLPVDAVALWVKGVLPGMIVQMMSNGIDLELVGSIQSSMEDVLPLDLDAELYTEWSPAIEKDAVMRSRRSVEAALNASYSGSTGKQSPPAVVYPKAVP